MNGQKKNEKRLRVLVISFMYPNTVDPSAGVFIEEQVKYLSRRCEVRVLSPTPWFPPVKFLRRWYRYRLRPVREVREGTYILRPRFLSIPGDPFTTAGFSYFFCLLWVVPKLKRSFDFDLVHAHVSYPDGFAAVLIGKLLKKPVVVTEHTGNFSEVSRRTVCRRDMSVYALKNAGLVISVSTSQREQLLREGLLEENVVKISNGVDMNLFCPADGARARPQEKTILFVGHLIEEKGVGLLLEAFRNLLQGRRNDLRLLVAGDGVLRKYLLDKTKSMGIETKVRFLGAVSKAQVAELMKECDVLVLPSFRESFGIVLVEAMACGKPVVATRSGGPTEIVSEDTGVLVPYGDADVLSKAIGYVLDNPHKFEAGKISRHVRQKYDILRVTEKILKSYGRVLRTEMGSG
jgi:glycosyltransferase involved in cell wall biosynthesis